MFTSLLAFSATIIGFFFRLIFAAIAAVIAFFKNRNPLLWAIGVGVFPLLILLLLILPTYRPRIRSYLQDQPEFQGRDMDIASILGIAAIVAKSDGQISKNEVRFMRQFVRQNYNLSKEEMKSYDAPFAYAKDHPDILDELLRILALRVNARTARALSYLYISLALLDSTVDNYDDELLTKIVTGIGLSIYEYASLKLYILRMHQTASGDYNQSAGANYSRAGGNNYYGHGFGSTQTMSKDAMIEKYTKILGVPKNADATAIKKAYRKLAKEYHPDKVISEGMPDEYVDYAKKRFQEITDAYEHLKELVPE